ncbi:MAG TPA: hypothetical protein VM737_04985 [Gemmatimonadota bacterium]|nr:hypothetical protein [Gemmatimonadota bacterium]
MDHHLRRLIEGRVLEEIEPNDQAILGYWTKARRAFADSRLPETSMEGAVDRAYQAAFLLATAVVHAAGYRVRGREGGHHYNTFYALGGLDDPQLARLAGELNDLRATRHEALYEAIAGPDEDDLGRMQQAVEDLLVSGREWLVSRQPSLSDRIGTQP